MLVALFVASFVVLRSSKVEIFGERIVKDLVMVGSSLLAQYPYFLLSNEACVWLVSSLTFISILAVIFKLHDK